MHRIWVCDLEPVKFGGKRPVRFRAAIAISSRSFMTSRMANPRYLSQYRTLALHTIRGIYDDPCRQSFVIWSRDGDAASKHRQPIYRLPLDQKGVGLGVARPGHAKGHPPCPRCTCLASAPRQHRSPPKPCPMTSKPFLPAILPERRRRGASSSLTCCAIVINGSRATWSIASTTASTDQAQPAVDQWPSRADEPPQQRRHRQTLPLQ